MALMISGVAVGKLRFSCSSLASALVNSVVSVGVVVPTPSGTAVVVMSFFDKIVDANNLDAAVSLSESGCQVKLSDL